MKQSRAIMNVDPIVSIITAVKNREGVINRCVQSVNDQTYTNIQHVIVDGNSTDNTKSILLDSYLRYQTVFTSEDDLGIYDAINKGIKLSEGNFLLILGSDDWLEPTGIRILMDSIKHNDADFAVGSAMVRSAINPQLDKLWKINNFDFRLLTGGMPFSHQSLLASRDCYEVCGLYNMAYKISADYEWVKSLFLKKLKIAITEECVVNVSADGISADSSLWKQEHQEQIYEHYKNPLLLRSIMSYIEYMNGERQLEEQEIRKIISESTNIDITKSIALIMLDRLCRKTHHNPLNIDPKQLNLTQTRNNHSK